MVYAFALFEQYSRCLFFARRLIKQRPEQNERENQIRSRGEHGDLLNGERAVYMTCSVVQQHGVRTGRQLRKIELQEVALLH